MNTYTKPLQRPSPNNIITDTGNKFFKQDHNSCLKINQNTHFNTKSIPEIINGSTCKYIGSLLRKAYSTIAPIDELCEAEDKLRKLSSLNSRKFDKLIEEVEKRVQLLVNMDIDINDYNLQRKEFIDVLEVIILQNIKQIFNEVIDEL